MGTSDMQALAKAGVDQAVHDTATALSPDVVASLVLNGDLSRLTQPQMVNYYQSLCARVGLDPATQPFKVLKLKGKVVMYADKGAAQQLSQIHSISHDVVGKERDEDIYTVTIRASMPSGRFTVEDGAVPLIDPETGKPLRGENLANAKMKAMTKAKRRAVLALLGLGMTDESEVEGMDGAESVPLPTLPALVQTTVVEQKKVDVESPVVQPTEQKEQKDGGTWLQSCYGSLEALAKKGDVEKARAWGIEAKKRLAAGTLTQIEFSGIVEKFRRLFPEAPAAPVVTQTSLFNGDGQLQQGNAEVVPAPADSKKKKKSDDPAAGKSKQKAKGGATADQLGEQIKAAEKLSVLFTIRGRIEKAIVTDDERKALFSVWEEKSAALKGAKG